jgi:hypothetical protein
MLIDYSVLRPPIPLLKAAGVTGVGRYLGRDCEPGYNCIHKNLTLPEKDALLAAGIEIWLSSEYAADAALGGAAQGTSDAQLANRQLHDLGMASPGTGVYYAIDFDIPDYAPGLPEGPANARAKLGPVAHYFDGIHAGKPNHEVDGYGGFWAIRRLLDAGLIRRGWQTLAWSGGNTDPRISLLQLIQQVLGAADVDNIPGVHVAKVPDFGQWPRPVVPAPGGPFVHWADGTRDLAQIAATRSTTEAHLRAVSEPAYAAALARKPLVKGLPYWTSNP